MKKTIIIIVITCIGLYGAACIGTGLWVRHMIYTCNDLNVSYSQVQQYFTDKAYYDELNYNKWIIGGISSADSVETSLTCSFPWTYIGFGNAVTHVRVDWRGKGIFDGKEGLRTGVHNMPVCICLTFHHGRWQIVHQRYGRYFYILSCYRSISDRKRLKM